MAVNTTAFIEAMVERVNEIVPCTYEEASKKQAPPYAVLNGIKAVDLEAAETGDLVSFYIDLWGDEKGGAEVTVELEELCDKLRNELNKAVILAPGVLGAHIGFDTQNSVRDNEYDLAHRQLSMIARVFYI